MTNIIQINPKEFGIEESKAADISAQFKPMLDKMVELEKEYNEVIVLPVETAGAQAKALRLKYVKVRTGTDKIHKEQKAFYLLAGRFVDGWKNAQMFASQGIEKKLEDIELFAINQEKERLEALRLVRENEARQYGIEDFSGYNLSSMSEDVYSKYIHGVRLAYQESIEAARLAEEKRIADQEAERIRIEEQRLENERLKAEAEEREAVLKAEREKAEQERKAAEDKLKAEREAAENAARIEREKADAILATERKAAADRLATEQEAARKVAAELEAKKATEKAEADRIAKEAVAKAAAEAKAAKAPVKEKLRVAVEALAIQLPDSELTPDIMSKFNGFKQWALAQINAL